jgi:putative transposase
VFVNAEVDRVEDGQGGPNRHARYRRAVKACGHFPNEQAAVRCLYLLTRLLDPTGTGRTRCMMRWKPALNGFAITVSDRFRR